MSNFGSRCFPLYCFLLFCQLKGCASLYYVTATVGADVSLKCSYNAWHHGPLPFCWGRESTSTFGCNNQVIKSDGTSVVSRLSLRYSLSGYLRGGDASLTIKQVQESDGGKYVCRVEIPGWFNDETTESILRVNPGRPSQPLVSIRELMERAVRVGWNPPFNGGRAITDYIIDVKKIYDPWSSAIRSWVKMTDATVVNLRPATTYNLLLFAVNSVGTSDANNVLTFTTKEAAPEGPPLDMQLQSLSTKSIKVTWRPPKVELRNGVLHSYTVSYRDYDSVVQNWLHRTMAATGDPQSVILTNLKPSTRYEVTIQARTNAGLGPASTAPLCSTLDEVPPDPPVIELEDVTSNKIFLFWTPGFEGDSPITGFYLDYKAANDTWSSALRSWVTGTRTSVADLHPATTYDFRLFAVSSVGMSKASNVLSFATNEAAPEGPPLDMQLQALSPQSINVTWRPPKVEIRNGILRSYTVSYRDNDSVVQNWLHRTVAATGDPQSIILTNLKPSTRYEVTIQARTNAGLGPASTAPLCSTLDEASTVATTITLATTSPAAVTTRHTTFSPVPPDPPVIGIEDVTNNKISLFWTPGFEGDSPITGFYLEFKEANASWDYTETVVDFYANETEATIIEINPSTYNIRMFAKNSLGTSNASNVLTVTIQETAFNFTSSSYCYFSIYALNAEWKLMLLLFVYLL